MNYFVKSKYIPPLKRQINNYSNNNLSDEIVINIPANKLKNPNIIKINNISKKNKTEAESPYISFVM